MRYLMNRRKETVKIPNACFLMVGPPGCGKTQWSLITAHLGRYTVVIGNEESPGHISDLMGLVGIRLPFQGVIVPSLEYFGDVECKDRLIHSVDVIPSVHASNMPTRVILDMNEIMDVVDIQKKYNIHVVAMTVSCVRGMEDNYER